MVDPGERDDAQGPIYPEEPARGNPNYLCAVSGIVMGIRATASGAGCRVPAKGRADRWNQA